MARLIWGNVGERLYETGLDRGVLYSDGVNGVPWNGLIAVTELSDNDSVKSYYLDGVNYLSVVSNDDFKATIEAYSSPPQFSAAEGLAQINNGLIVANQPRKPFGMTYRSKIGNDVLGDVFGYKLHIVYDAVATGGRRNYTTLNDGVETSRFKIDISGRPQQIAGHRPSAHFVVDTRFTPEAKLLDIENLLYGSNTNNPTMPTATQLLAMFA